MGNAVTRPVNDFELSSLMPANKIYRPSPFQSDVYGFLISYYENNLKVGKKSQAWRARPAREAAFKSINQALKKAIDKKCDNVLASAIEVSYETYKSQRGPNNRSRFHDTLLSFAQRFRRERDRYGLHIDEDELADCIVLLEREESIIESNGQPRKPRILEIIERKNNALQALEAEKNSSMQREQALMCELIESRNQVALTQRELAKSLSENAQSQSEFAKSQNEFAKSLKIVEEYEKKLSEYKQFSVLAASKDQADRPQLSSSSEEQQNAASHSGARP